MNEDLFLQHPQKTFAVIKSHESFDARTCTARLREEIQFKKRGRKEVLRPGYGNGNTWASGRWLALSRNTNTEYLSVTYCWHRRYAEKRSARRRLHRVLLPFSALVRLSRTGEGARSHSVSPATPLANCHFTDSLFCENRLHSDSNEGERVSFTPCHASYTP